MLKNLKLARLERSLSQLELAILAEVSPNRISLAERGLTILEIEEYQRLAKELDKPLDWILEDQPEVLPFGGLRRKSCETGQ
jgi:transcriptional regulator with XRE-family HTH domain